MKMDQFVKEWGTRGPSLMVELYIRRLEQNLPITDEMKKDMAELLKELESALESVVDKEKS